MDLNGGFPLGFEHGERAARTRRTRERARLEITRNRGRESRARREAEASSLRLPMGWIIMRWCRLPRPKRNKHGHGRVGIRWFVDFGWHVMDGSIRTNGMTIPMFYARKSILQYP